MPRKCEVRIASACACRSIRILLWCVALVGLSVLAVPSDAFGATHSEAGDGHGGEGIGTALPLWSTLPFLGILLSIAIFPLTAPKFWHHHYPKISFAWALILAVPFLFAYGSVAMHEILHIYLIDYVPFIILLWGLFTVAGGIVVRGAPMGTPIVNTAFLLIGTLIASWTGTTGASVLLIRPLLRANERRRHKVHVIVFFIFLVANIGGSLTPLGDPPLFLGFLHGVSFTWTFHLLPPMSLLVVSLLLVFYYIDRRYYLREVAEAEAPIAPAAERSALRLEGSYNLIFLGGILGAVLLSGVWKPGDFHLLGIEIGWQDVSRDLLILLMGAVSLYATPGALRDANRFSWEPIREVAYLFAGIFMTIVPALAILKAGEAGRLGFLIRAVRDPDHYFWAVGGLSSFLDNAPTYLTFFNTALGRFYPGQPEAQAVAQLIADNGVYLMAIATGAVFMGANTYIGNAPNFMVKSIAEEAGVGMPSFFGYLFRWSIPILLPLFAVVALVFF